MDKTDGELVAATLKGETQAFEQIIKRYQKLVFNIIYHQVGRWQEVEDLAQEVFLKTFKSLDRFDQARSLKPLIAKITVNRCLDELRKKWVSKVGIFSDFSEEEEQRIRYLYNSSSREASLTEVEAEDCFKLLDQLLNCLPQKDRTAFLLRDLEGFGYDDISKLLGTSETAVRIRVSRTRKRLSKSLSSLLFTRK